MKKNAFTLLELLVVMVIVAVISAVAIPSFFSMGKGMAKRTATSNIHSTISLSRQWAITHREQVTFVLSKNGMIYNPTNNPHFTASTDSNAPACYYAVNDAGEIIQSITSLPLGILAVPETTTTGGANGPWPVTFKTDGGLTIGDPFIIKIYQGHRLGESFVFDYNNPNTITINWLTGGIKME